MHYHMTQRIDGGEPQSILTDAHFSCMMSAFEDLEKGLPLLGYRVTEKEENGSLMWIVFQLDAINSEDRIIESCTVAITGWQCTCSSGDYEIRQNLSRQFADLN